MEESVHGNTSASERERSYTALSRKFIAITLASSVLPLLLVGWGIYLYYSDFSRTRMLESFKVQVEHHRSVIEVYLRERIEILGLVAYTHNLGFLQMPWNLLSVFEVMNRGGRAFEDLSVMGENGAHLAYVGPYDLSDKNYAREPWFLEVMEKGVYISDMFLGFRKVPHFIVAVLRVEDGRRWVLRATVDAVTFRSLVETATFGATGEVTIVNREGVFQTTPRSGGAIMERAAFPVSALEGEAAARVLENGNGAEGGRRVVAHAWLREPRWALVVTQNYDEAFAEANRANRATLVFLHLSALAILVVALLTTRRMIRMVRKRDNEAERLNSQLMQAGKLASIGELSAGVAHEINNPLAIILTERQLLQDLIEETEGIPPDFQAELETALAQVENQITRCKRITHNLLRFARRTRSVLETVDLNAFLREVVDLVEREAKSAGITFETRLDPALPGMVSDPSELQQVFLNLITNAIDAHDGKPGGLVSVGTSLDTAAGRVAVTVADSGAGIAPENLEKIFDPFFTTKAVGKGTGLGLSITYSIVKRLGGEIAVESEAGKGTRFTLLLPLAPPETAEPARDKGRTP